MKTLIVYVAAVGLAGITAGCSDTPSSDASCVAPDVVVMPPDTGSPPDAGPPDMGVPDTGTPDTGTPDAGTPDASDGGGDVPDAGPMRCPPCTGDGCTIVEITTGSRYTCARRAAGSVLCWGDNSLGQLGDGTMNASARPVEVLGVCDAVEVEAGSGTACARRRSGRVSCWGGNGSSALGAGLTQEMLRLSTAPLDVRGIDDATALEGGSGFACALRRSGGVWCWGTNAASQLGQGSMTPVSSAEPLRVVGLSDVVGIAASQFGCAVRSNGQALCWGRNTNGRFGNGTTTDSPSPTPVASLTDITALSNGVFNACALRAGGTLSCWGENTSGSVGVPAGPMPLLVPTTVPGVADVVQVEVGFRHVCALLRSGAVTCWGKNDLGELGRGTTSPFDATPMPVMGLTDATEIAAHSPHDGPEGSHTCAIRRNGEVVCWGKNDLGQLGDGTMTNRPAPVRVMF